MKSIPLSTPELLTSFVKSYLPVDKCWLWQQKKNKGGYGLFEVEGRNFLAHRVSWTWYNGPIPLDLVVCHACDHPACVNPSHLMVGSQHANMVDSRQKHRKRWAHFSIRSPKI